MHAKDEWQTPIFLGIVNHGASVGRTQWRPPPRAHLSNDFRLRALTRSERWTRRCSTTTRRRKAEARGVKKVSAARLPDASAAREAHSSFRGVSPESWETVRWRRRADCETDSRYGVTVPEGVSALRGVHYLHGLFPEAFLAELEAIRASAPVTLGSRATCTPTDVSSAPRVSPRRSSPTSPPDLGFTPRPERPSFHRVSPGGAHPRARGPGVRRDDVTFRESTTSMLLFTEDVPEE